MNALPSPLSAVEANKLSGKKTQVSHPHKDTKNSKTQTT